MKLVNIQKEKD